MPRLHIPTVLLLSTSFLILLTLSGCAGPIRADCANRGGENPEFGDFESVPKPRMGAIPFPGIVSLYADADPDELGDHIYQDGTPFKGLAEMGRGIMYTRRAGFLDLAHIRNTIDNTAHIHARMRYAFRNSRRCVRFRLFEPSVYRVEIEYPEEWFELSLEERLERADRLAINAAEALGFHSMTWHEILTWYGYKSAIVVSEKPSSFTYEDAASHAVGARVAGIALSDMEAIRRRTRGAAGEQAENDGGPSDVVFGEAVTTALEETLADLGVVDVETSREAVSAVSGEWYSGLTVDRRHVIAGTGGETIEPWIVPGFGPADGADAAAFRFPALDDLGEGPSPRLRVLIDPRVREEGKIMRALADIRGLRHKPDAVDVEEDFPMFVRLIRNDLIEQNGVESLEP